MLAYGVLLYWLRLVFELKFPECIALKEEGKLLMLLKF